MRLQISDPRDLKQGDRVYINEEYQYTVENEPNELDDGAVEVLVKFPDQGTGLRVFDDPAEVWLDEVKVQVERA